MKKRQKVLSEEQWQLIEPLLPKPRPRRDKRGRPPAPNRLVSKASCGFCRPCGLAFYPTAEFPPPSTCGGAATLAREGRPPIAADLPHPTAGSVDAEGLLQWDESFLDGELRQPVERGGSPSVKQTGQGTKWWYWSTVKVFRWEFGWKVPLRQKLRLRKPRSLKSASRGAKAARGKSPSA